MRERVRTLGFRIVLIAMLGLLILAAPASAGGWATVELDQPVVEVPIGESVLIGFRVLGHGVSPIAGVSPYLTATHRDSGAEIRADGQAEGAEGHYVVEVAFPEGGEWKWRIFTDSRSTQSTAFPAVTALPAGQLTIDPNLPAVPEEDAVHPAEVVRGGCGTSAPLAYALTDVAPRPPAKPETADNPDQAPVVKESETVLPVALTDLADGLHAVAIRTGETATGDLVACGAIVGDPLGGALVVGLTEADGSGYVGFARLAEDATGQTTVTVYLARDLAAPSPPAGIPISINDGGFSPSLLEIAAGTTVSWINDGVIVHTVESDDIAFDDSGILHPGDRFSQTFDEPGVYSYLCGPHPHMAATIVVT